MVIVNNIKFLSFIKSDKLSNLCLICFPGLPLLFIIVLIIVRIFRRIPLEYGSLTENEIPGIVIIICISTVIGLICWLFRYIYFKKILYSNVQVKGIVEDVIVDEFQFRTIDVRITYEYFGKVYHREKTVMDGSIPRSIRKGAEVIVLINPKKPKQFLIADLYVNG